MIRALLVMYSPLVVPVLVYMLQASDYQLKNYFKWLLRVRRFDRVMTRRRLDYTQKASLLVLIGIVAYLAIVGLAIYCLLYQQWVVAALGFVTIPYVIGILLAVLTQAGYLIMQKPKERQLINNATNSISRHRGVKIAVAGSYGKTTFKELLYTVLDSKLHVAASPGNMNTAVGLSRFAAQLDGTEDVLIFEFGEEKRGDVKRLCNIAKPGIGIITGISEAHLETFKSVDEIVATIFELQNYIGVEHTYKNADSGYVAKKVMMPDQLAYTQAGVDGWRVGQVTASLEKTEFTVKRGDTIIHAKTALLGEHQIGPICACIDIAYKLGMTPDEIEKGLQWVAPFEHRMQPRNVNGALVIDDTYNGNINGVESGLRLLEKSNANRKIYVTPGLVEQGRETGAIHTRMGELIAPVADVVVLMKNSTTNYICQGLKNKGFTGKLKIIDNPLEFYENIQHFVVAGDVVLMQNDWTDNYA